MKNIIGESHRIANELEHEAAIKCEREVAEAETARKAYYQACEDFARQIRKLGMEQDGTTKMISGNCEKCGAELLSLGWLYCPDCGREIIREGTE